MNFKIFGDIAWKQPSIRQTDIRCTTCAIDEHDDGGQPARAQVHNELAFAIFNITIHILLNFLPYRKTWLIASSSLILILDCFFRDRVKNQLGMREREEEFQEELRSGRPQVPRLR